MMGGPGGFGGGQRPEGMEPPEGADPSQMGERPERPPEGSASGPDGEPPEGTAPDMDGREPPEGFEGGQDGMPGGMGGGSGANTEGSTAFTITSAIHAFSGVSDSPDGSGKTRVTFTVNGGKGISSVTSGTAVTLTGITSNVSDLSASDVQVTVTDVPSEDYAETCLLSEGLDAVAALLPTADGTYQLTVAVVSANESYAGVGQWQFTIGILPFSDVRQNSGSYEAIQFVYDSGLMEGTGGGMFSPDGTVTRAQAITVLARLAGADAQESNAFSDVTANSWYSGYVGWAVENGSVQGDGQGHFLPDSNVTVEHMELMITRYAGANGIDYTPSAASTGDLTRAGLAQMLMELAQAV